MNDILQAIITSSGHGSSGKGAARTKASPRDGAFLAELERAKSQIGKSGAGDVRAAAQTNPSDAEAGTSKPSESTSGETTPHNGDRPSAKSGQTPGKTRENHPAEKESLAAEEAHGLPAAASSESPPGGIAAADSLENAPGVAPEPGTEEPARVEGALVPRAGVATGVVPATGGPAGVTNVPGSVDPGMEVGAANKVPAIGVDAPVVSPSQEGAGGVTSWSASSTASGGASPTTIGNDAGTTPAGTPAGGPTSPTGSPETATGKVAVPRGVPGSIPAGKQTGGGVNGPQPPADRVFVPAQQPVERDRQAPAEPRTDSPAHGEGNGGGQVAMEQGEKDVASAQGTSSFSVQPETAEGEIPRSESEETTSPGKSASSAARQGVDPDGEEPLQASAKRSEWGSERSPGSSRPGRFGLGRDVTRLRAVSQGGNAQVAANETNGVGRSGESRLTATETKGASPGRQVSGTQGGNSATPASFSGSGPSERPGVLGAQTLTRADGEDGSLTERNQRRGGRLQANGGLPYSRSLIGGRPAETGSSERGRQSDPDDSAAAHMSVDKNGASRNAVSGNRAQGTNAGGSGQGNGGGYTARGIDSQREGTLANGAAAGNGKKVDGPDAARGQGSANGGDRMPSGGVGRPAESQPGPHERHGETKETNHETGRIDQQVAPQPTGGPPKDAPANSRVAHTATRQAAMTKESLQQMVKGIESDVKDGVSTVRMELSPGKLGHLELKMAVEHGVLTARFVAQSEHVKALIESSLPDLRHNLAQHGVDVRHLSVGVGGEESRTGSRSSQERPARPQAGRRRVIAGAAVESESIERWRPTPSSGVDVLV